MYLNEFPYNQCPHCTQLHVDCCADHFIRLLNPTRFPDNHREGDFFCERCANYSSDPKCLRCAGALRRAGDLIDHLHFLGFSSEPFRNLKKYWQDGKAEWVWRPLAKMFGAWYRTLPQPLDFLIPVPARENNPYDAPSRVLGLLATQAPTLLRNSVIGWHVLKRTGHEQLKGYKYDEKFAETYRQYGIGQDWKTVRGRSVLLIDDWFTTGATLNTCTRILRQSGATKIEAFTFTRNVHPSYRGYFPYTRVSPCPHFIRYGA